MDLGGSRKGRDNVELKAEVIDKGERLCLSYPEQISFMSSLFVSAGGFETLFSD